MKTQTNSPREPLSKMRLRLWLRLLKTQNAIEGEIRRRLRDQFGSTLPRFDVMSALSRFPDGLKMSEISSLLKVSNGNVTGIVDRLTQDGFVLRVAVPEDRRAQLVRLTPSGEKAFASQAQAHEQWLDEMFESQKPEDIDAFCRILEGITDHLEEKGAQIDAQ